MIEPFISNKQRLRHFEGGTTEKYLAMKLKYNDNHKERGV